MGNFKELYLTWFEQEATEDEKSLPYEERMIAFELYLQAHEGWIQTVHDIEDKYFDKKLGINDDDPNTSPFYKAHK